MDRIILGIDISKLKFDVCLKGLDGKKVFHVFDNDTKGFKSLSSWLKKQGMKQVHAVMEATGSYGEDLSYYLFDNQHVVSVVNPAQIKFYGQSLNSRTKTDKADAQLIADFGLRHELRSWSPMIKEHRKLRDLMRCLRNVRSDAARQRNRLENSHGRDKEVIKMYKSLLKTLEKKLEYIENKVNDLLLSDPGLEESVKLLETIPGFGRRTSCGLLAEMPNVNQFNNSKQVVAFYGLNPSIRKSGTSVNSRGKISKKGSPTLRTQLYLPALTAMRCNPVIKRHAENLRARGKNGKTIVIACMRKLLEIAYGILKHREPFRA